MTRVLVVGKRSGILQWYEHLLAVDGQLPGISVAGFALNHNNAWEQLANRFYGKKGGDHWWALVAQRLAARIRHVGPDLILVVDRFYFTPALNDVLAAAGCPVVQWIGDRFDGQLAANAAVSRFYFTDSAFVGQAEAMGLPADYLPLAVDPGRFLGGLPWAQRKPDLLFVGAHSANRQACLEQVTVPILVYGKGWDKLANPQATVHARNIPLAKVAKLYGEHRMVLNIINSDNIAAGLNMRCFEATAAGACLVTDRVADLERCFEPGVEVLDYASAESLGRRLAEPGMAERAMSIAAAGARKTRTRHTYSIRLAAVLAQLLSPGGDTAVGPKTAAL